MRRDDESGNAGEEMFERLCAHLALRATRIEEVSHMGERRPDYEVVGNDGALFIAEVKAITPNAEELADIARLARREIFATSFTPGGRMRQLIRAANGQLRALADMGPGALFIFNPEVTLRLHTDPYAVLTAMRGFDVVDVAVPRDPGQPPVFGELRSGAGQRMTPRDNTSTSAIVTPIEVAPDEWHVSVFHNRFAARKIPISAIRGDSVKHWFISADERDWTLDQPTPASE